MHHAAGLHSYCFRSFLGPLRLIILPRWDTQAVVEAIPKWVPATMVFTVKLNQNRYKITFLGLVPSIAQQLLAHPMIDQIDFSSVLDMSSGAAYLPRKFLAKLVSLHQPSIRFTEGKEFLLSLHRLQNYNLTCSLLFVRIWPV